MNFVNNYSKNINKFIIQYGVNILNKYYMLTPRNMIFIMRKNI